jgi:transposase, IS30 family
MGRGPFFTEEEKHEIWARWSEGLSTKLIAESLVRSYGGVKYLIGASGGIPPRPRRRSPRNLSAVEREEISRGLEVGEPLRRIAQRLQRAPSTISREVRANGGRRGYRAWAAEIRAAERARRPKIAKLVRFPKLGAEVDAALSCLWSPQQIARRLRLLHPDEPEMWVSHETIYQSLFVQGRGALRAELAASLRSGRAMRRPRRRVGARRGQLKDMVMISERPAEVEDRAVPGHWEGDLLIGKDAKSAIVTLVERSTRYVMLGHIGRSRTAPVVRDVLTSLIQRLPNELARSLTWDQGKEMAEHPRFTLDTGVDVYFCDPHSPWQRGSNENTNGLLRQYFPKGTALSRFSQEELDAVARQLNGRPRETLGFMTPSEKFTELVASTA